MKREEILDGLRQSPKVDVCVIGGGINGISVFRELALQGLNVLLVEKRLLLRRQCRAVAHGAWRTALPGKWRIQAGAGIAGRA
jgi:glycine/D-amino acid oxidase-like deaminating enzyme